MKKLEQNEFIERVKNINPNLDLSKSIFINTKVKVNVTCNECGKQFEATPNSLLNGHGCPRCCNYKKGEYYINKFIKKHVVKYDYSLVKKDKKYSTNDTIEIICSKHGIFKQKIKSHLHGYGCKKCGMEKCKIARLIPKDEIINRINKLCENKFSYNIDEYENTNTPFQLICLKCGYKFKRDYNALCYNDTCPSCNGKPRNRKYSTNEFIQKSNKIHNFKYDYSKTIYNKTDDKVIIICHNKDEFGDEHGEFLCTPHAHIGMKSGCPKCSNKYKMDTEYFIKKAKLIHGNKYDYSKVTYVNAKTHVNIECKKHGIFKQTPNQHLSGEGCPRCKKSKVEQEILMFLKRNNIIYYEQYSPPFLERMSLDFYIPSKKIAIEVQGLQHFKSVKYWGGEESHQKIKKRDELKRKLCQENNIEIIYYSELNIDFPYEIINNKEKLLEIIK